MRTPTLLVGLAIVLARPLEHLALTVCKERVKQLIEAQLGVRVDDMLWRRNADAIPVYGASSALCDRVIARENECVCQGIY